MNWYLKVLKQYADFNGRARRKEYWMFFLFNMIIYYGLLFIGMALLGGNMETGGGAGVMIAGIYVLATLIPSIAVAVRRMHDVGKSGWFCLIPIYNLILAVTDSEKGSTKYGPNPKNEGEGTIDDHLIS